MKINAVPQNQKTLKDYFDGKNEPLKLKLLKE
jgi:hypothetical protein